MLAGLAVTAFEHNVQQVKPHIIECRQHAQKRGLVNDRSTESRFGWIALEVGCNMQPSEIVRPMFAENSLNTDSIDFWLMGAQASRHRAGNRKLNQLSICTSIGYMSYAMHRTMVAERWDCGVVRLGVSVWDMRKIGRLSLAKRIKADMSRSANGCHPRMHPK